MVTSCLEMSLWVRVAILAIGAAFLANWINNLYTILPVFTDGTVDPKFKAVQDAFRKNFEDGWERDGAAFAVYWRGQKVVDLWGGYADVQAARKWDTDVMTIVFSVTKAVAAICMAMLVEAGRLSYDDHLVKFWPEFGKAGKDNITVQWSGVTYIDSPISFDDARDHQRMSKLLEQQKPEFPPGTGTGYQVYTYGWLVDQIIRRVDTKHRGIGQFFKEEIAIPYELDFHIGLPPALQWRMARIRAAKLRGMFSEMWHDWRIFKYFKAYGRLLYDTPLARAVNNPTWLEAIDKVTYNNPDYQRLELAASLGISNAETLARMFSLLMNGRIVKPEMVQSFRPIINETDLVSYDHVAKGYGFLFLPRNRGKQASLIGHPGHGCQMVFYDPEYQLAVAYVTNGLKTGLSDLCRTYYRLYQALYDVIEK